ncbi:MAG: TIGR03067 domain-containing protein [Chitinophagaceae bacterium]|nr:TIGR03067 domain-containing protein [Chitinophagaceae bacterium]MBL0131458.1 TIGR03067 domain-containing protein [Chitinophagaceae bacterium]
MRLLTFITLLILGSSCGTAKKALNATILNGDWTPIKQEMGGKEFPPAVFEKQKLIIHDSSYTLIAESVDKGILKYSDHNMDIYGKEGVNSGKHFTAIYKFENKQLTICYNLMGNGYPESYETKGKPLYFLSVFKKN